MKARVTVGESLLCSLALKHISVRSNSVMKET